MMDVLHDPKDFDPEKSLPDDEVQVTELVDIATNSKAEARLVRRIDMRFVPASMIIYLLNFIDRINIGNARLLNSDTGDSLLQVTHLSSYQYLVALMIFIIAYTLFEVPSNYMLKKYRPSRWLALLLMGWGATTMLLGAVKNFAGITAVRFFLGMFEAGLFPSLVYATTFWYKLDERALRVSLLSAVAALAGAFGGAIAYGIGHMNGLRGLEGWRWLFILEGAPSCICAIFVFFLFPDFPETVAWLSEDERRLATERIKGVAALGHAQITWDEAKATLTDWRLYLHHLAFIGLTPAFGDVALFTPSIVDGLGYTGLDAQLFTVPPYAIAFVVTVFVAWQTDKHGLRGWGSFLCLTAGGVAFIIQGALPAHAFRARYGLLCVAVSFTFASAPPMLSWLMANLRSTGALTLGVPMNISISQIGEIIGVWTFKTSEAPGYPTVLFTNGAFLLMGAVTVLVIIFVYVRRNSQLQPGERRWEL